MDGNNVTNWVIATGSAVTATAITYGITGIRRVIKRLSDEHNWLMRTTKENSEAILRLMKIVEKRIKKK